MARHAILQVSLEFIVTACKVDDPNLFFTVRVKEDGLPKDAELVGIVNPVLGHSLGYQSHWNTIGLVVASASFEDIPYGQPLPILPPPIFERQDWEVNILRAVEPVLDTATPSE